MGICDINLSHCPVWLLLLLLQLKFLKHDIKLCIEMMKALNLSYHPAWIGTSENKQLVSSLLHLSESPEPLSLLNSQSYQSLSYRFDPKSTFSNLSSYQLPIAVISLIASNIADCSELGPSACFGHFPWTILSHYFPNTIFDHSQYYLSQQVGLSFLPFFCALLLLFFWPFSSSTEIIFSS